MHSVVQEERCKRKIRAVDFNTTGIFNRHPAYSWYSECSSQRTIQSFSGFRSQVRANRGCSSSSGFRRQPTGSVVGTIKSGGYGTKEIGLLQHTDDDIRRIVLVLQGFAKESSTQWGSRFTLHKGIS